MPSDSDSFSDNNVPSSSPPASSSTSPLILYSPPTIWSFLRGAAINLVLPFVNGLMLGFGELLAHEAAFRLGWGGTKYSAVAAARAYRHQPLHQLGRGFLLPSCRPSTSSRIGRIQSSIPQRYSSTAQEKGLDAFDSSIAQSTNPDPALLDSATLPVANPDTTFLEDITSAVPTISPDQIGYLKSLGLDFGWGPTAMMQWLLEHIHVWTGLPWWMSVTLATIAVRLVFAKPQVDAADVSAKISALRVVTDPIQKKIDDAKVEMDSLKALQARQELNQVYMRAGIKVWKTFIPLLQIPLGFGSFRLLRGMSTIPVPALETEQFLWLENLTVSDPTYILPLATGYIFHRVAKAQFRDNRPSSFIGPTLQKILVYGLPLMSTIFMTRWPSIMQWSFFVSGSLIALISTGLRNGSLRRWLRISPLIMQGVGGTAPPTGPAVSSKLRLASDRSASAADAAEAKAARGVVGGAIAEVQGMGSEAMKTWRNMRGKFEKEAAERRVKYLGRKQTADDKKHEADADEQRRAELQAKWAAWRAKQQKKKGGAKKEVE
ncbi:MAG: Mitochondrial inner membrane protein oxa1 [Phylliscum demangeonii]|nr:MAG: Mitochondrial inner membrane protein oxa1 [Phylliscum demangeonii]